MRKYIIKRILISIVILFFVAFVIYALMRCLPTSYVEAMARQKSMQPGSKSFEEWMAQLTRMYNLDVGIVPGFFKWLGQMLTFQFGDSWLWTKPVTEVFNDSVWISFFMGLIAFVLEIIIAIPLGVIAATKQYSKTDYVISVLALAGISLPTFFFASLLKLVFSVKLGWFDLYGLTGRSHQQLSAFGKLMDMGHHLVLPIVTLVVISVGSLMRYTRTNMLEVLNADFIRTPGQGSVRAQGHLSPCVPQHPDPPGYHHRRFSARPVFRRTDHRDAVFHPRHRLYFLPVHGGRRHSVLHVLSGVHGRADPVGQPDF